MGPKVPCSRLLRLGTPGARSSIAPTLPLQLISRPLSTTAARLDDAKPGESPATSGLTSQLQGIFNRNRDTGTSGSTAGPDLSSASFSSPSTTPRYGTRGGLLNFDDLSLRNTPKNAYKEPYHLHVYAHKHNTHITMSKPNRDAILSLSCGNLGFKNSKRKFYDAAYQLAQRVVKKLREGGVDKVLKEKELELIFRGFGPGRDATQAVLLTDEAAFLKNSIVRVADATRIKFGGCRSRRMKRR